MAYGLRCIANKGYVPNGTGRDWFFLGDVEFRSGNRTPMPNEHARPDKPKSRPRGLPAEAALQQRFARGKKEDQVKKWLATQTDESPDVLTRSPSAAAAAAKARGKPRHRSAAVDTYETSYSRHGRIPGFSNTEWGAPRKHHHFPVPVHPPGPAGPPATPHVSFDSSASSACGSRARASSEPPGTGDPNAATRARVTAAQNAGATPNFATSYSANIGQIPGFEMPEWGAPLKHQHHSTGVYPGVNADARATAEAAAMKSTYADMGSGQNFDMDTYGAPTRHHHHSMPCMPTVAQAAKRRSKKASEESSFETTYGSLCRGPGWDPLESIGPSYDLGQSAYKHYRFTIPPKDIKT